jgi:putative ABC transport system permease protein
MLKTQLKLAFRNFRKYPAFSLINLGGLSIGIASSFVLLVYSQREMSTDKQFRDADRIVRIGTDFFNMGGFALSQPVLRDLLRNSCKDIQYTTAMDVSGADLPVRLQAQDRAYTGTKAYYIDSSFFKVFSYEAEAGSIPAAGLAPGQAILSETNARRFFGSEDPIGKILLIGKENTPHRVVAVLQSSFQKSHLDPQILLPLPADAIGQFDGNWSSASLYNYAKLNAQGSIAGLKNWFDRVLQKLVYPSTHATIPFAQWKDGNTAVKFYIQPLTDIYFHSNLNFDLSPGGNLIQVKILSAISIFLILLAVINYVNLVTARSTIRSKEIGLKKTFGATRGNLGKQILTESLLFSFLAMLLSIVLIRAILFAYEWATGSPLTGPVALTPLHYTGLVAFSALVGAFAGVYPAFYLTRFKPILTIRSLTPGAGKGNSGVRNALVMLQFIIAAGLLFVSIVVYGQLQYMKNKDKGFKTQGMLEIDNMNAMGNRALAFQHAIGQESQVVSTSFCKRTPAGRNMVMYTYKTPAMAQPMTMQTFPVDADYIATLGMHLTTGRNFSRTLSSDTNSLILNESAVAALGLFNPVGSVINGSEHVIGVVKDFNFTSFRQKIAPAALRYSPNGDVLAIRISGGNISEFLGRLNALGKQFGNGEPLAINFLDDNFAKLAEKETLLGKAISFFTILAIVLATFGLIGLTLFTIERRTREIGIRKVLGASVNSILGLVSKDFIRLAAIASLIAFPIGWWLMNRWLDNFAYRIHISPWTFFMTGASVILIALTVVSLLALKAATANPVSSLRSE